MDGSVADHSDSDSGESWTLLEHSPSYAEEAPDLSEKLTSLERDTLDTNAEKDEDTDGISIISDSESESSSPCEISLENYVEENRPAEQHTPHYISVTPLPTNNTEQHESIRDEDDFLTDNNGKNKTYVHRRNKRLSTVLNIIMLGSVITAAGVAIGHMWGARNDCSMHTAPSVNKILSNLYKLQEENAYLRSKLKEFTLISNAQLQRKTGTDKLIQKPQRCRKVYEESLNNKITDKITKCVDNNVGNIMESHLIQQQYEKDFLDDLDRLKNAYQQNKSWLDSEVTKRLHNEDQSIKKTKHVLQSRPLNTVHEEIIAPKIENAKIKIDFPNPSIETKSLVEDDSGFVIVTEADSDEHINKLSIDKKISYADSLKTEQPQSKVKKVQDTEGSKFNDKMVKDRTVNKNRKGEGFDVLEISSSDFKFIKDDRYNGPKNKRDKKKNDRQKLHKKQKRKNKYEQWEMKGGYMKDYDDISLTSSQENENALKMNNINNYAQDPEPNIFSSESSEMDKLKILEGNDHKVKRDKYFRTADKTQEKTNNRNKELNWFEKRAVFRTEARKKLEQEMFGETSLNNASWYFRRMQKREQCRAKGDNSTYRKFTKRHMNYKVKH